MTDVNTEQSLEKQLFSDVMTALNLAIELAYPDEFYYSTDFDETYVYFGNYKTRYRLGYSITDNMVVTLDDTENREEVNRVTEYVTVKALEEAPEKAPKETVINRIRKFFGQEPVEETPEVVVKSQFNDETNSTIEFLYIHPNEVDGHGDSYDQDTADAMVESLNKANEDGRLQSGLFHKHKTATFSVTKAFIAEEDCTMGEFEILKGQPLVEIEYKSPKLYELRKAGTITGPSIGARAKEIINLTDGVEKSLGEGDIILCKSSLDEIKSEPVAKRILKGIHFNWPNPEITLTDASQGGAASLKNDIILEKAMADPNETQQGILDELEEEFTPLAKAKGVDTPIAGSPAGDTSVTTTKTEGSDMSDTEIQKELATIRHDLAVSKAENVLMAYELGDEIQKELADVMAQVGDDSVAVTKALDALVGMAEYGIAKSLQDTKKEDSPLAKALDEEAGAGGEPEVEVEKSFEDQVLAAQAEQLGAK